MFDLYQCYQWEIFRQYRAEEDRRRHERARLLAELRRSQRHLPSVRQRLLMSLGSLLIRCGQLLQGQPATQAETLRTALAPAFRCSEAGAPLAVVISGTRGLEVPA